MTRSTLKRRYLTILASTLALLCAAGGYAASRWYGGSAALPEPPIAAGDRTRIGINLSGLATFNRQQVFTDLTAQSEWFSSRGDGWTMMPARQLDSHGWPRFLEAGQTAPRPLILPPAPFRPTQVRCRFAGTGSFAAGGVARMAESGLNQLTLDLELSGVGEEGAWIELLATAPDDPVRNLDCREADRPWGERFHPQFLAFLRGFTTLRFLDWQRTNDNFAVRWQDRALPQSSSQVAAAGASVEDMVDLANLVGADPWFLMPYRADDQYVRRFAQLVRARLDPSRRIYVELGNEIWNDMFAAARQAEREGVMLRLGGGDPVRARTLRYAQKLCRTMHIWDAVFASDRQRLIRVAASQNAYPDLSEILLGPGGAADCVDALATAPYIWIDLDGRDAADRDLVFAQIPDAIGETIDFAARNRAIAMRHGKRFIAYEGGQHLVTKDLALGQGLQRDRRMGGTYRAYLDQWNARIRSDLVLYASSAPIADYGSWGLQEYAGQPHAETPKLTAVRGFMARAGQ